MNGNLKEFALLAGFILIFSNINAQINYKFFSQKAKNSYMFYCDNNEYPITIKIDFKLKNFRIIGDNNPIYVVPPKTQKHFITELAIVNAKKSGNQSGDAKVFPENSTLNEYDREFLYYLPFNKDQKYTVSQGYNCKVTHQSENCLDFNMPVVTEITAIRDGLVTKAVNDNDRNCFSKGCTKYNNFITIMHSDETFAEYTHLTKNGNIVNAGDTVTIGQAIGYSINTGYSNNSHLHIVVYRQKFEKRITHVTKFLTDTGEKSEILKEKHTYTRNY
jgi:hypothetical protein